MNRGRHFIRMGLDRFATALIILSVLVCLFPLAHMLGITALRGLPALNLKTLVTPTTGIAGGLSNAIVGTMAIVGFALAMVGPLGILGALYVSEFASARAAGFIRFVCDILTGVPSIVLGYFGYVTMVLWFGWGFSLAAASITLVILMLPYVMRSADLAMQKVPQEWRQASLSLGATPTVTAIRIVLPGSIPGTLTGVMIATGIAVGETAPLIFTAGWSNYMPSLHLTKSAVGYLTYVVWTYISMPYESSHALAYAAAFVLIVMVFAFNAVGRLILRRRASFLR